VAFRTSEEEIRARLAPLLDDPTVRRGIEVLATDPFFTAFFLTSVSQGEGLGAAAVSAIGDEEIAARLHDLARQEAEERGHEARSLSAARRLFPEYFDDGAYRFADSLQGRPYYVTVLEANRERLKSCGRYSRLNQYLTTTFGYEVMVVLLYRAAAEAFRRATGPHGAEIATLLDGILDEEETHLGILEQHQALLELDRAALSPAAAQAVDGLGLLSDDDYAFAAELAVRQVVDMMSRYAEPAAYRAEIEAGRTDGR
jgi:hypothetical protein